MFELGEVVSLQMLEQYRNARAFEFFNDRWNDIVETTMFSSDWEYPFSENGIPIFWPPIDSVQFRSIPPGRIYRTMHESGQRMLVVGTRLGPAVVYTGKNKDQEVIMCQFAANALLFSGFLAIPTISLDVKDVRHLLGTGPKTPRVLHVANLGEKIEGVYRHFTNPELHSLQDLNQ
jgi:hypothetical protein